MADSLYDIFATAPALKAFPEIPEPPKLTLEPTPTQTPEVPVKKGEDTVEKKKKKKKKVPTPVVPEEKKKKTTPLFVKKPAVPPGKKEEKNFNGYSMLKSESDKIDRIIQNLERKKRVREEGGKTKPTVCGMFNDRLLKFFRGVRRDYDEEFIELRN